MASRRLTFPATSSTVTPVPVNPFNTPVNQLAVSAKVLFRLINAGSRMVPRVTLSSLLLVSSSA
ncbi:hypothetical protein D3C87_1751170 [compost metagenome]